MSEYNGIVKVKGAEFVLGLISNKYLFIRNIFDSRQTDIFKTKIFGKEIICMGGIEANRIFYDNELFIRKKAAPPRIKKTLTGKGAVHALDNNAHKQRKALFLDIINDKEEKTINELVLKNWISILDNVKLDEKHTIYELSKLVLLKSALEWTGVPFEEAELKDRAQDFMAMVIAFGRFGAIHSKGRTARNKIEQWLSEQIAHVRQNEDHYNKEKALYKVSFYKENEQLLPLKIAAVELINCIRPIVAVSLFVTFTALALHLYPEYRKKLLKGDEKDLENFAHEIRRFYPLAPFLGARIKKDFSWNDYSFKKGNMVILDVYGTNHSYKIWDKPYEFNPDRFNDFNITSYNFIPQGGGVKEKNHRCPGEGVTVEIMKASLNFLINYINYNVPKQNLNYSLSEVCPLPQSKLIINQIVKKKETS